MSPAQLKYLYDLGLFNIKLGLDNIKEMMSRLGNPHLHPRVIHVAGTNGKGSTLVALEKLLLDSGFTVGGAISPHLLSYNERFRINGKHASDKELEWAFQTVCQSCEIDFEKGRTSSKDEKIRPTFFEFSIAMAFALFKKHQVQYIILETGMGGRLDATNIVPRPLLCVLTAIGLDHQEYLGKTIERITDEKLGIVKQGAKVLVAPQQKNVERRIRNFCLKKRVDYFFSPKDFGYEASHKQFSTKFYFSYQVTGNATPTLISKFVNIEQPALKGEHQRDNMATALAAYFLCVPLDKRLDENSINLSLQNIKWAGRLQYLNGNRILLDGAHNLPGMESLLKYLESAHSRQQVILALGWMKNKNIAAAFDKHSPSNVSNITFQPLKMRFDRSEDAEVIFNSFKKRGFRVLPPMEAETLARKSLDNSLPEHDLLTVSGSLYLLAEFLTVFNSLAG